MLSPLLLRLLLAAAVLQLLAKAQRVPDYTCAAGQVKACCFWRIEEEGQPTVTGCYDFSKVTDVDVFIEYCFKANKNNLYCCKEVKSDKWGTKILDGIDCSTPRPSQAGDEEPGTGILDQIQNTIHQFFHPDQELNPSICKPKTPRTKMDDKSTDAVAGGMKAQSNLYDPGVQVGGTGNVECSDQADSSGSNVGSSSTTGSSNTDPQNGAPAAWGGQPEQQQQANNNPGMPDALSTDPNPGPRPGPSNTDSYVISQQLQSSDQYFPSSYLVSAEDGGGGGWD